MIEHLKNIGNGLWLIGIICVMIASIIGLAHLIAMYPIVLIPVVLSVAWAFGRLLRGLT